MIVGGVIGGYFVAGNEKYVISYGTGFVGAGLIARGAAQYLGGFPSMSDVELLKEQKMDYTFIAYVVGVIAFAIAGGCVQMKRENDKDDDYMKQDDM